MDVDDPRSIRVFVSSTFRDMQLERDELVKRVFPQVRRLCEQRGVSWSEIDLRWGVTDEQKAEGAVLPICLAEIERTRPYFIGLLGQRYGWVPDEIPDPLRDQLGWLDDDRGRSVTELEILHGVLNAPEAAGHAYFYLRDPAWVDSLDPDDRATFVEDTETGVRRLDALRRRIRESGHPTRDYPDPVALGDLVLADLIALVESRYPDAEPPEPIERDRVIHRSFSAARHRDIVERPAIAAALDRHSDGAGGPILVTGRSGVGASALVATWAAARRSVGTDVIEHHVEADATAADPAAMVVRLVGELAGPDAAERARSTAGNPVAARSALASAFAAVDEPVVVILDGVDRLDDVDGAPDLRWLPSDVPARVHLVLVASGERPRVQVERRGWPVLEVPPLDQAERRAIVDRVLARYAKALDRVHVDQMVAAETTGNARFLRIVLDELRQHGDHFTLGATIARLCSAASVQELYEMVLDRYERDFERDQPGLTHSVFGALWAARRGLAEAELLEVVGLAHGRGEPLPQAVWAPLHLAAEAAIIDRGGLLGFSNEDLRQAVQRRYLGDESERRAAHGLLARTFADHELGPRVVDELAWQQVEAGDVDGLAATLSDLAYTEVAYTRASLDLRRSWARAAEAGCSMVDAFRGVIDRPADHDSVEGQLVWGVSRLLTDAGHPTEALAVQRYLVDRARVRPAGRSGTGDERLRAALVNLGATLWTQGLHADAETALAESTDRCRAAGDDRMLASSLGNLAMTRRDLGDLDGADALFTEEAELCRRLDDEFGLQASLGNRAELLRRLGRPDTALELLREQEQVCRDLADDAGIARALAGQAAVLADRGEITLAIELTERHVAASRGSGDTRGLTEGLLNLTVMHSQVGAVDAARSAGEEAEETARRLGDPSLLARVLLAAANVAAAIGSWDDAERIAREAELTARNADLTDQVAIALGLVGTARRERGDLAGARTAHEAELATASTSRDPIPLATAHANLAALSIAEQRYDDALTHFAAAEPTFRAHQLASSLLPMLANRGQVLHAVGRHADAAADFADATAAAAQLGLHTSVIQWGEPAVQLASSLGAVDVADGVWRHLADSARALGDEARLQQALGERALIAIGRAQPAGVAGDATNVDRSQLDTAAALLDEQEDICRRTENAVGLAACVGNRAIVARYRGDLPGSLALLDEQLRLAQESGNGQGVLFATANRGEVLGLLGRVPEALEALEWARGAAAQHGIAPMVQQLDAMIAGLRSRN